MKTFNFIWLFVTNKTFRYWLEATLHYAITAYENTRGQGASDVLIFERFFGRIIFTPEKFNYLKREQRLFQLEPPIRRG